MSESSNPSPSSVDLGRLLEESGAVLRGHFLLSSGRHSDVYFEKFRVLSQPRVLSVLCAGIAAHFRGVRYVAGPTTGGIIIAFEVARQLGIDAVYVEDDGGKKALRRGQTLATGASVLVVDDVLTTGLSVNETIGAVKAAGGDLAGVGVLIDRSDGRLDFGCELFAAYRVEAVSWPPEDVPEWLAKVPVQKPGTRKS